MKAAKYIIQFILYNNILVSLSAVALCSLTASLFAEKLPARFYILIFFLTLTSYSFHWSLTGGDNSINSPRIQWNSNHRCLLILTTAISCIIAIYLSYTQVYLWLYLIPVIILTLLYTTPKIPLKPFKILRNKAYGKTFYLAFVWAYTTSYLPIVGGAESKIKLINSVLVYLLLFFNCIFFDFKDRAEDGEIKNLITHLSKGGMYRIIISIPLLCILIIYQLPEPFAYKETICIIPVIMIDLILAPKLIEQNNDFLYYGVLDGALILPWAISKIFLV